MVGTADSPISPDVLVVECSPLGWPAKLGHSLVRFGTWAVAFATSAGGLLIVVRGDAAGWWLVAFGGLVLAPIAALITWISRAPAGRRVVVDFDHRQIIFESYPIVRGFWPRPDESRFVCRFDEITSLQHGTHKGNEWLTVRTRDARAEVQSWSPQFRQLNAALRAIARERGVPFEECGRQSRLLVVVLVFCLAVVLTCLAIWLP